MDGMAQVRAPYLTIDMNNNQSKMLQNNSLGVAASVGRGIHVSQLTKGVIFTL